MTVECVMAGVVTVDVDGSERLRIKLTKAADRDEQQRKMKAQRRADRHRAMQDGEASRAEVQQQAQQHSVLLKKEKKMKDAAAADAAALQKYYISRDTPRHAKTRPLSQYLQQQIMQVFAAFTLLDCLSVCRLQHFPAAHHTAGE